MLKFGPVPPSGDRLQRGFQPASSLFSYEATQNRMQDPRIPKKVLTHNNVRPPYWSVVDHPSQGRSQWIDLRLAEEYTGGLWAVIGQKSMPRGKAHLATNINRN